MSIFTKLFYTFSDVTHCIVTSKQRAINENRPYLHNYRIECYIDQHSKIFGTWFCDKNDPFLPFSDFKQLVQSPVILFLPKYVAQIHFQSRCRQI